MQTLEERLKEQAAALGFELAGIAEAGEPDTFPQFQHWLDQGFAGEMAYMERHAAARRHPDSILSDVGSVILVALNYKPPESQPGQAEVDASHPAGRIARYARGQDYHGILRNRLKALLAWLQAEVPGCQGRAVVDTAPLLERDYARRAGLGWFGKNTMLLNKQLGSYFFLGALLVSVRLRPDEIHTASHCGTCTACLDACPTQAFVAPGQLDARRCISYVTIELRTSVPPELREPLGDWLFGCDICQEVCPWNRRAPVAQEPAFASRADLEAVDLVELLALSAEEFLKRFHGTALMRAGRRGLLRNAALLLGNLADESALPFLQRATTDPEPLIREAAQWAIDRILGRFQGSPLASPAGKPDNKRQYQCPTGRIAMKIRGIIPPVATPMKDNEDLDLDRFKWFLDYLIGQRVHGVFVLGTNSEFYALDEKEKQQVVATAVAHVNGRVPVFAGTGAETTREVVRLTKMAEHEGADGVSVITPYFIQPTQQEIFDHYRRIAECTALPVILYNNPGTCGGVKIDVDTALRLAEIPSIVGIKDSSGDLQNTNELIRSAPDHFSVLQGRDTLIFQALIFGARGAIPASANVAPRLAVDIYEAVVKGDIAAARSAQLRLTPVRLSLALGTAPGGVKAALALLGMTIGPCRSPVGPLPPDKLEKMRGLLKSAGLLR